ncbi:MAG: polygalacturonase [Mucilaginibacter sp.]|nr:polygalacturonase [Mucilaginibacter sp.]
MKSLFLLSILALIGNTAFAQQKVYNITAYGAKPDAKTNNALSIQKAIDAATADGGGMVLIPAGKFVTGVIDLKSGVDLHLDANAQLLGSTTRADYGPKHASALIVANQQHHIAITGKGVIDGQAVELLKDVYKRLHDGTLEDNEWNVYNPWHQMRPSEANRPKLIEFINCDDINIKNITLKDGLSWVQKYNQCSNMIIDSMRVESTTYWNNDGIDLVDCKNVKLTNSFINADDDGICLKSEDPKGICENIYIANCTIRSSASALKLGTASFGGFKKITVRDIKVYDTFRSAIALESVDGAVLEDIDIRNVTAKNTGNAIFIRLGQRNKKADPGKVRHIYIGNVKAEIPSGKPDKGYPTEGPASRFPHNVFPSSIVGIPGYPVQDVTLENIEITYGGDAKKETAHFGLDSLDKVPENIAGYPEFSMFGELPAWGLYIRHADGIKIKNMTLKYQKDDFRTACIFDDVTGLNLNEVKIPTAKTYPVILFKNVTNPLLKAIQIPGDSKETIKKL